MSHFLHDAAGIAYVNNAYYVNKLQLCMRLLLYVVPAVYRETVAYEGTGGSGGSMNQGPSEPCYATAEKQWCVCVCVCVCTETVQYSTCTVTTRAG